MIFLYSAAYGQEDQGIATRFIRFSESTPVEKVYLDTDRNVYSAGDTLWMSGYALLGPFHNLSQLGSVIHTEIVNSEGLIVSKRDINTTLGRGFAEHIISREAPTGKYILRGYTNYMRNFDEVYFFRKPISIFNTNDSTSTNRTGELERDSIQLRFYPEGGQLVNDLMSIVAVKVSIKNKGIKTEGKIINQRSEVIKEFNTNAFGMGRFTFQPSKEEEYRVVLNFNNGKFPFSFHPIADTGYTMSVRESSGNYMVAVQGKGINTLKGSTILAHTRGFVHTAVEHTGDKNYFLISMSKAELPPGITQITFFDSQAKARCERLVYKFGREDLLDISIAPLKSSYGKREKVEVKLNTNAEKVLDSLFLGSISVSVTGDDITAANSDININNYLHFVSDIDQYVKMPGYVFDESTPNRDEITELYMLTSGWKRFKWEEVDNPEPLEFEPQHGYRISGQLMKYHNQDKPQPGKVRLFFIESPITQAEIETGEDGRFSFNNIFLEDTLTAVIQASRINKRREKLDKPQDIANILIKLDKDTEVPTSLSEEIMEQPEPLNDAYVDLAMKNEEIREAYNLDDEVYILDEIEIEEKKNIMDDPFYSGSRVYSNFNHRIVMDSIPDAATAFNLMRVIANRVPGSILRGDELTIRRGGVSYMIDDVRTDQLSVSMLNITSVSYIDVIIGGNTAAFGLSGESNVISIYTRQGGGPSAQRSKGIKKVKFTGIYPPIEFSNPDYSIKPEKYIPDYRKTIYWNPKMEITVEEDNSFEFYTSDQAGKFNIEIEGITPDGRIIYTKTPYFVK